MKPLFLLPLILLPLRADAPSDLKARLAQLQGRDLVKGQLERQLWQQDKDGKEPAKVVAGAFQVLVEDGPQGIQMQVSQALLAQARKEQEAALKDPEKESGTAKSLKGVNPVDLADSLSAATGILRDLAQSTFLEEKAETFEGQPARLLLFKPEPKLNAQAKKALKSLEATLKVWIAADGTPLAMEEQVAYKASKFFMTFEGTSKTSQRFRRIGNRLVVLLRTEESSNSGLGNVQQKKVVTKFQPV
ncbi:MAG TPA: hypothetical protein VJ623_02945 [Holophagaceae bacterium]|nr:hypothetical protein [Holophagaceae bacterium]